MGFQPPAAESIANEAEDMVRNEVKRVFNPEFLNRLDEIILFNALSDEDLIQVIQLMVGQNLMDSARATPLSAQLVHDHCCLPWRGLRRPPGVGEGKRDWDES